MIKMTIQDTEETAEFKVLEKPIIQKPLIAESDVVTIDNNLSTYVTGTQKRELTVGLGYLDSIGYETLRRIRDRQYAVLKYPTVTITADEPVDLGYGEDVPDYRQKLVQLKGKNLAQPSNGGSKNGITISYDGSEDVFVVNGTCTTNNTTINILESVDVDVGDYTLSVIPVSGSMTYHDNTSIQMFDSNWGSEYLRIRPFTGASASATASFTSAKTLSNNGLRAENGDVFTNFKFKVQLEKGSSATTFEPYTDIELCKIGTYQDKIYKSGDKWYVHKAIGIKHFSDVNSFVYNNGCFQSNYTFPNDKASQTTAKSDSFTFNPVQAAITSNLKNGEFGWNTTNYLTAKNTALASKADWKTWLASNNPVIYYILATPTDTELTNSTLITQLDTLQNSAFDRWTGVETEVQELSLQPYLTVTQGEITDSGKEVMLEGTTEDLLDFVILGDTFQQTYSGKNLFPPDNLSDSQGIKWIVQNDEIIGSGTAGDTWSNVDSWVDTVFPAGTYTISFSNSRTVKFTLRLQDANGTNHVIGVDTDTTKTFTTTWETRKLYCNVWALTSGTRYDINLGKIQIESGSPATTYEPYVGGVPAPNPAFPQDVQTVNGSINFDFSGPSGVKKYTMVGKMTLADQRIIDNCGTNEQVQVSFRESKQL